MRWHDPSVSRSLDVVVAAVASAAVAAGAHEVHSGALREVEGSVFSALNGLSDRGHVPVWAFMQAGSLGGAVGVGAAVASKGDPALGRRLATVGSLAWLGSKAVKPLAQRGRPAAVVVAARVLGRAQAGLGYPSGHAAVAAAMASAASPRIERRWRAPLWLGALGVGLTRVYVGAHLPLDVLGGVALGVAVERTVRAISGPA